MKNLLFIFSILLMVSACKKDDPIITPTDPCENIVCVNGSCVNGLCDCLGGYDGPSCNNQITPTSMRIVNIRVLKFPALKSAGGSWDINDGADLFVKLYYNGNAIYTSGYVTNADASQMHTFTPSQNLLLNNVTNIYEIQLWDLDDFIDDQIGAFTFIPYSSSNGFPPSLTWAAQNGNIEVRFDFQYTW